MTAARHLSKLKPHVLEHHTTYLKMTQYYPWQDRVHRTKRAAVLRYRLISGETLGDPLDPDAQRVVEASRKCRWRESFLFFTQSMTFLARRQ